MNRDLTRVGVFYDGNYFLHVSNYYNYIHSRRSRISISGLHEFIRNYIARAENKEPRLIQISDAHYFRGRLNAKEASLKGNLLYYDRVFDDILMSEGVVTHYLPIRTVHGRRDDKGLDVWLALEAFEQASLKKIDVLVLIVSDGDYVPLIRKINSQSTRIMILSWDFEYTNDEGHKMETKTSSDLLREVSYPVAMHDLIDRGLEASDKLVTNLFVQNESTSKANAELVLELENEKAELMVEAEFVTGEILSLKNGYGFIKHPPNNLFFHYSNLVDTDFNDLNETDLVTFIIENNEKGEAVAKHIRLVP